MDHLDVRILDTLQQEGDLTQAGLAGRVGSTPSTCLRRVQRLKANGYLRRCVFLADPNKLERGLKAVITVVTKSHGRELRKAFAKQIREEPAITTAYGVTGDIDAVLVGNFSNMEEYQEMCDRLFDHHPHVVRYTTAFATESYKDETAIPTDSLAAKLQT